MGMALGWTGWQPGSGRTRAPPLGFVGVLAAHGFAGVDAGFDLAFADYRDSVDDYVRDAFGVLGGVFVGGFVEDFGGVEEGDVGVGAFFEAAFVGGLRRFAGRTVILRRASMVDMAFCSLT